jgi:hypothetical protein
MERHPGLSSGEPCSRPHINTNNEEMKIALERQLVQLLCALIAQFLIPKVISYLGRFVHWMLEQPKRPMPN